MDGTTNNPRPLLTLAATPAPASNAVNTYPKPPSSNNHTATMDPFSSEVELVDLRDHFAAGRFQEVVDYDTTSLSPENKVPAHILALRAKVALGEAKEALAEIKDAESGPEYSALKAYAQHATGKTAEALKAAEALAASAPDNATVQLLAGSVLQSEGKTEEALALLSQHQGNCGLKLLRVLRLQC